jgi:hypothetical protein
MISPFTACETHFEKKRKIEHYTISPKMTSVRSYPRGGITNVVRERKQARNFGEQEEKANTEIR